MCAPVALAAAAVVGGMLLSKALTPNTPDAQTTAVQPPATQDAKSPTAAERRATNTGVTTGMNAGPASTLLTGPAGVDPNTLSLDKTKLTGGNGSSLGSNTLLGM